MRATQIARLIRLTFLFAATRVVAEESLTHWGVGLGMGIRNVATQASNNTDTPLQGFVKLSGIFSLGSTKSTTALDLSTGFLFVSTVSDQQPDATQMFALTAVEGYFMEFDELRYGLAVQGEFSLDGNGQLFDERRVMVGPSVKFFNPNSSDMKAKLTVGYIGSWLPKTFNNGFGVMISGAYLP